MSTPQPAKQFQPLCYEHHVGMEMTEVLSQTNGAAPQIRAYACPQHDCGVRYTPADGYFAAAANEQAELEILPRVKCSRDGQPMFLAGVNPMKRDFRLWRCPKCDASRTNEEELVGEFAEHPQG